MIRVGMREGSNLRIGAGIPVMRQWRAVHAAQISQRFQHPFRPERNKGIDRNDNKGAEPRQNSLQVVSRRVIRVVRHRESRERKARCIEGSPRQEFRREGLPLQHSHDRKRDGPDRPVRDCIGQKAQQEPRAQFVLRTELPNNDKYEAKERRQCVAACRDEILEEQKIAQKQKELLDAIERRPPIDDDPGSDRQSKMENLKPDRVVREARDQPCRRIPERRVSIELGALNQAPKRLVGIERTLPGLELVAPHWVAQRPDCVENQKACEYAIERNRSPSRAHAIGARRGDR